MKKLSVLLVVFCCSSIALIAQDNADNQQLKYLLGNENWFPMEEVQLDSFSWPKIETSTMGQNTFPALILPDEKMTVTPKGLLNQNGTTYHILIKEPDMNNVVPMPTKKDTP